MSSFFPNQIWIGTDDIFLNFFATFDSVLGRHVTVLIKVSQIHWDCLLCLFKCWALPLTSWRSLLHSLSCHQTYRIGWTLWINPIHFLTHHCYALHIFTVYHSTQFLFTYMYSPVLMCHLCCVMVAVRTCMVVACSSIDWLLQLPGAVLLIGRAPFVCWGVSNYCALTEVFLLPRIQLCSLHRLNWLLLPYDYRHDYFLVSSMLKLSSLKPSKYTRWIFASIGRFVTI